MDHLKLGMYGGSDAPRDNRATGKWTGVFVSLVILLAIIIGLCSFLRYRRVEQSWQRQQDQAPPPGFLLRMVDRMVGVPDRVERIAMTRRQPSATPREVFDKFPVFLWKYEPDSEDDNARNHQPHSPHTPVSVPEATRVPSQTQGSEQGAREEPQQQQQSPPPPPPGSNSSRAAGVISAQPFEQPGLLEPRSPTASIHEIPTVRARPCGPTVSSQDSCTICLDDYVHDETLVCQLPCSHIYHVGCIERHLIGYRASERETGGIANSASARASVDARGRHSISVEGQHPVDVENSEIERLSQGLTAVEDRYRPSNEIQSQHSGGEEAALDDKSREVKDTTEQSDEVGFFDSTLDPGAIENQIRRDSAEISNPNRTSHDSGARSRNSIEIRVRSRSIDEAEIQEEANQDPEQTAQGEDRATTARIDYFSRAARARFFDRILGPEVEVDNRDHTVYQGSTQCPVCKATVYDPNQEEEAKEDTRPRWYRRVFRSRSRNQA